MARIFIIFHDCTHNSFFRSRKINNIISHISGVLVFTAFHDWQLAHKIHHATSSNLDKRGMGDLWVMTVNEYYSSSLSRRLWYHLYRNPIFLFIIAAPTKFIFLNRIPKNLKRNKELVSQIGTTVALALIIITVCLTIGFKTYILLQLSVIWIGSSGGLWLFFIQHQFEDVYWSHNDEWDGFKAAMYGASFYKLPGLFRWFSGNIGYHHIHHLMLNIPCYNLKICYEDVKLDNEKISISFRKGFRSVFLKLYDEETKKLVSFKKIKMLINKNK
jgi:omega-6 fatty acid desaturase (delta-12 desaturase)